MGLLDGKKISGPNSQIGMVFDATVNGLAALIGGLSSRSRRLQTGFARSYALSMFAGATLLIVAVVLVRI